MSETITLEVPLNDRTTRRVAVNRADWEAMTPEDRQRFMQNSAYASAEDTFGPLDFGGSAQQIGSGFVEGLTQTADLPSKGFRLAENAGNRLYNLFAGEDVLPPDTGLFGQNPTPFTDALYSTGVVSGADPRNPGYHEFGRLLADSAVTVGPFSFMKPVARTATGYGPRVLRHLQSVTRTPTRAAATIAADAGATYVGGEIGEAGAREYLGDEWANTGKFLGQVSGPMALSAAAQSGDELAKYLFGGDGASQKFQNLAELDIPATPGMVGSSNAVGGELGAAAVPGVGSKVDRIRGEQIEAMDDVVRNVASDVRGGRPSGTPSGEPSTAGAAGELITEAAKRAQDRLKAELKQLTEQEFASIGGRKQALQVDGVYSALDEVANTGAGETINLARRLRAQLDEIRDTPIDPQLHNYLTGEVQKVDAQLKRLETVEGADQQIAALRNYRRTLDADIDANIGVRAERLDDWRKQVGLKTDAGFYLTGQKAETVYGGIRSEQRATAQDLGAVADFDEAVAGKQRILNDDVTPREGGDMAAMEAIIKRQDNPKGVYDKFFSKSGVQNVGQLARLKRSLSPEDWNQVRGDVLEAMVRPKSSNQMHSNTALDTFSSRQFRTAWGDMPTEVRELMFEPETIAKLDRLAAVAKQLDELRGTGAGAQNVNVGTAVATGAGAANNLPAAVQALTIGNVLGRNFVSEEFARIIADEGVRIGERTGMRAGVEAVKAVQREGEDQTAQDMNRFMVGPR